MTKWIAVPAGALLFAAAWGRPAPELPVARRPAPPVVDDPPVEAATPQNLLEALTGALPPSPSAAQDPQEPPHRKAVWTAIARSLERAYAGIYDERYLRAVRECERILRIDPHYGVALELRNLAQRLCHMTVGNYDGVYRRVEPWVVCTKEDPSRPAIPAPETFRLPGADEWAKMDRRTPEDDGDPTIEEIRQKLETLKIDLAFENTTLEDILAFLRDVSGLNILLDAAVRDHVDPDKVITFKVKDLALKNILKLLLAQFQLDYRITEERVVLLTNVFPRTTARAGSTVSDGERDFLTVLSAPFSDPPLTSQEPAVFIESLFIDLDVQNAPMSHIVDLLRSGTGVDLRLAEEVEETISFKVRGTSLRAALMLLLQPRNLSFTIENATVWIGRSRY